MGWFLKDAAPTIIMPRIQLSRNENKKTNPRCQAFALPLWTLESLLRTAASKVARYLN